MARQLKRWESPRREGRNAKGKGGSARSRQRRKQLQALRQKLKDPANQQSKPTSQHTNKQAEQQERGSEIAALFVYGHDEGIAAWQAA